MASTSLSRLSVFERVFALLSVLSIGSIMIRFSEEEAPTYRHIDVVEYSLKPTATSVKSTDENSIRTIVNASSRYAQSRLQTFRPKTKCRLLGKDLSKWVFCTV